MRVLVVIGRTRLAHRCRPYHPITGGGRSQTEFIRMVEPAPFSRSVGDDEGFEQVVEVPLNPFAQHETVIAGELTRVVA
jgi:hypothetical protein